MTRFKELFISKAYNKVLSNPSVSVTSASTHHTLFLRFDTKDVILDAAYSGKSDPWLSSLCELVIGKSLFEASSFTPHTWEESFREDQTFWDLWQEQQNLIFYPAIELLRAALDIFRGRDYLYHETSPLICRCFGVRESDVLAHMKEETNPTLDSLSGKTKAGMGCRSCVPQLNRWLALHGTHEKTRFYKERPVADWLLDIDYHLSQFPLSAEWKMEVKSFKGQQVVISYDKTTTQREEEEVSRELQEFLGEALDPDLGFFLIRERQRSKALG